MMFPVFAFLVFFHLSQTAEALQEGYLHPHQKRVFYHANFIPHLFHHLRAPKISFYSVKHDADCPFKCIDKTDCSSFNVGAYPNTQGFFLCELFDTDKYTAKNKLQENATFHHYSRPWLPCQSDPCLNNGDCISNFHMNSYHCFCKPGFGGTRCEVCKFDFEDGIDGWIKTGTAFDNQPTFGDNPDARNKESANHQGDWWIGGFEDRPFKEKPAGRVQGDVPQGTLTSPRFNITGKTISFLIGGCYDMNVCRAELIVGSQSVRKAAGSNYETMTRKLWNVQEYVGKSAQFKLVDFSSSGWGHINFDDFKGDIDCGQK